MFSLLIFSSTLNNAKHFYAEARLPWLQNVMNQPAMQETGGTGLIPGSGRSFGEGNGYPLQYSCLGNPMNRGAWHY